MILIKYNEIMSNATVDPEMKSRIMAAVSKAIKEQPGGAVVTDLNKDIAKKDIDKEDAHIDESHINDDDRPVRKKKAKKTPISLVASIAAGVLVLLGIGALGIAGYFDRAKTASAPVVEHNTEVEYITNEIDSAIGAESPDAVYDAAGNDDNREVDAVLGGDNRNYSVNNNKNYVKNTDKNVKSEETTAANISETEGPTDQVMGDERLDKISKALPFDLKGTGTSQSGENISVEIFLGVEGEKILLYAAPEGTDLMKELYTVKYEGVAGTTPAGTAVTLYRIPFNNVKALSKGETSTDVNAALFTKGGRTYLILFSDIYTAEQIGKVVDAI